MLDEKGRIIIKVLKHFKGTNHNKKSSPFPFNNYVKISASGF